MRKSPAQLKLHFLGICGKGMGPIATALAREGWSITGSDQDCYAPMSALIEEAGISLSTPYHEHNIPADADLVVVGKRVAENNPELRAVLRRGMPFCSFPELLNRFFLMHSRNAVVAGGVGKTTTTAMLAWILEHAGLDPNFLIGGIARNLCVPARLRQSSPVAVLEGDEYATCFNDLRPKFHHYRPYTVLITNIIEDHPDLYPDLESLQKVFVDWVRTIPADGCLALADDDPSTPMLAAETKCKVVTVGWSRLASEPIQIGDLQPHRSSFVLGGVEFELAMLGRMNIRNAAMAAIVARHYGVPLEQSALAMARFAGVENRQQSTQMGDVVVINDKATHPQALQELFLSLRQQHPGRRLVSVIQPRATGGQGWVYQQRLPDALAHADKVILTSAYEHQPQSKSVWAGGDFSNARLQNDLQYRGVPVSIVATADLPMTMRHQLQSGDVVVLTLPEQALTLRLGIEDVLRNS